MVQDSNAKDQTSRLEELGAYSTPVRCRVQVLTQLITHIFSARGESRPVSGNKYQGFLQKAQYNQSKVQKKHKCLLATGHIRTLPTLEAHGV